MRVVWGVIFILVESVSGEIYSNVTLDPASRQLQDFKKKNPHPIGVITDTAGYPVEIRDTVGLNSDILSNAYLLDLQTQGDTERIPERVVHAKGNGAFGYFEVTHDVSKYTKADVFNGIGKKTPLVTRFSIVVQNTGGNDLARETRGLAIKFYTNEGNLDLIGLSFPVYFYRDPILFTFFMRSFKRNPKTNLLDSTSRAELLSLTPETTHGILWLLSDYGINNGYRKMDNFPIHTYEVNNKHGESFFVKFNFRTEQGVELLTTEAARVLAANDPDYAGRDLYNAIEDGNFPSWRLEMDVIPKKDIKKLDYNPFDVTRLWKNGTYFTVPVGRMVLNRNVDNNFKDVEQSAYNPGNLVPGIPGPPDTMFKARRLAYRDTQNYRLGPNHNKIDVNAPLYAKLYSHDGQAPVRDNMRDVPNYYQNSFSGPIPYVDEARPKERVQFYDRNVVDLEPSSYFYNTFVTTEGHRNRLAASTAQVLVNSLEPAVSRSVKLLTLVDKDLGRRVRLALAAARTARITQQPVLAPIETNPTVLQVVSPAGK